MLRYYEEANLLRPETVDQSTGYRFYSSEQIQQLNKIIFLRDMGFNITEMSTVLSNWDDDYIKAELLRKQQDIKLAISQEQDKLLKIDMALKDLQKAEANYHYDVVIKNVPAYTVISLRKTIPNYFAEGRLWHELAQRISSGCMLQNQLNIALYHDEEFKETDVDVEVCTTIPTIPKAEQKISGLEYRVLEPVPYMACVMVRGNFENIGPAFYSVADWISQHKQFRLSNLPNRQICHRGPWNEESPQNYLIEIQIPVEKR